jgi:putrescine aminotransferase
LARGLDILGEVVSAVEKYRASSRGTVLPPVTVTLPVSASRGDVLALLREQPRRLDPFAAVNSGPSGPADFEGTLGDDVVRWTDVAAWSGDTLHLTAAPGWLWTTLERRFAVRDGAGGGAEIEIRIDWDAGTGEYEGLLAGRISYFVTERLAALGEDLRKQLRR